MNSHEHQGLVHTIARRYTVPGVSFDDLVQEGLIGLYEAEQRYDPDRKVKFATYASFWVKKRILAFLSRERQHQSRLRVTDEPAEEMPDMHGEADDAHPVGHTVAEDRLSMYRELVKSSVSPVETEIFLMYFGKLMTLADIAGQLGISTERVRQLKQRLLRKLKINAELTKALYAVNRDKVP
jgi:RNA polymerase sigma factor (sigma-70 family)